MLALCFKAVDRFRLKVLLVEREVPHDPFVNVCQDVVSRRGQDLQIGTKMRRADVRELELEGQLVAALDA